MVGSFCREACERCRVRALVTKTLSLFEELLILAEIAKQHVVGSAHGQHTFEGGHRLARRKTAEGLGTQEGGLVSAAHSRGLGREQGSAQSVDEARTRGRS